MNDMDDEIDRRLQQELSESRATLTASESEWRDKGPLLRSRGYVLRSRYQPDWVPSWRESGKRLQDSEDWHRLPRGHLIDATRVEDGRLVYVKRATTGSEEMQIAQILYNETLRSNPRNHSVPILDVFPDDVNSSVSYIVMPYLRLIDDPPFETVDEVVNFVDQILEGLVFMHEQGVAHRDCTYKNLMMDATPMYPRGFHPVRMRMLPDMSDEAPRVSRTEAPVRYYFIDYDISVFIPPDEHPKLVKGRKGRDRDPPELSSNEAYDPFKLDVFIIGNVFRKEFYDKYSNLEFLRPLCNTMMNQEPESRPDAAQAEQYWRTIRAGISRLNRVSSLRGRNEVWAQSAFLNMFAFVRLGVWMSSEMWIRVMRVLAAVRGSARQ